MNNEPVTSMLTHVAAATPHSRCTARRTRHFACSLALALTCSVPVLQPGAHARTAQASTAQPAQAVPVASFRVRTDALPAGSDSISQQLEALNQTFRKLYQERTRQVLTAQPLILVVQNNAITAIRGDSRQAYPVPLQRYKQARAVLHSTLAYHGLMQVLAAQGADADWQRLQAFIDDLGRARTALPGTALTPTEQQLAAQVLDQLAQGARSALMRRQVDRPEIARVLHEVRPAVLQIAESVGQAHAANLRNTLQQVRQHATDQEWSGVVAVVTGPMTARRNNLEAAAVASVLGEDQLGTRIFYSENIFSVDGALGYAQTVLGDRELSENVFSQPGRMWEDLFAPVSRTFVNHDFLTDLNTR